MEIFFKTRRAWTCFFVNPELNFATFFFIFYFLIRSTLFLWKSDFMFRRMVFLQGYQILGADEKTKKSITTLFIRNRNLILLLHCLIFEGACFWKLAVSVSVCRDLLMEMGSTFKKQWKYFRFNSIWKMVIISEEEQGYRFYLLTLSPTDCFLGLLMPDTWFENEIKKNVCWPLWHRQSRKQLQLIFWANKNDTLAGLFYLLRVLELIMNEELWIMSFVATEIGSTFKR